MAQPPDLFGGRPRRDQQQPRRKRHPPTKLGAKNWLFIGREDAGEKSAILYTLVENCRRLGIDAKAYFEDVLTRLPGMLDSEAASLTRSNWQKARSGKAGRAAA